MDVVQQAQKMDFVHIKAHLFFEGSKGFPSRGTILIRGVLPVIFKDKVEVLFVVTVSCIEDGLIGFLCQLDFFPCKVTFFRSVVLGSQLLLAWRRACCATILDLIIS